MIEFISPQYDIAVLRVLNAPIPFQYLRLTSHVPPTTEQLVVFGYPHGSPKMTLYGRVTSDGFVKSTALRKADGGRLFNLEIDILPLAVTIYGGMSGGPVFSQEGVVGILSGSLNVGGAIAWAIPVKYISETVKVHQKPSQIKGWPKLDLMTKGWESLRKFYVIDNRLDKLLQRYWKRAEMAEEIEQQISLAVVKWSRSVSPMRQLLETMAADSSMVNKTALEVPGFKYLSDSFIQELKELMNLMYQEDEIAARSSGVMGDLSTWVITQAKEGAIDAEKLERFAQGNILIDERYAHMESSFFEACGYSQKIENAKDFATSMLAVLDIIAPPFECINSFKAQRWLSERKAFTHDFGYLHEELRYRKAN
jgi:hypothetical protein